MQHSFYLFIWDIFYLTDWYGSNDRMNTTKEQEKKLHALIVNWMTQSTIERERATEREGVILVDEINNLSYGFSNRAGHLFI